MNRLRGICFVTPYKLICNYMIYCDKMQIAITVTIREEDHVYITQPSHSNTIAY